MERTPEDDAPSRRCAVLPTGLQKLGAFSFFEPQPPPPSPAETSAEAIRPNPAVAGVARLNEADRVREWRRRACNTDEARAKNADRVREWRRRAGNTDEARAKNADRVREWRRRACKTDEARAKEAERKRLQRLVNIDETRAKEAERKRRQRLGNIDETRAKEAERKRRQRKANAGESSTSSSATSPKRRAPSAETPAEAPTRKRRAPPADPEASRRRNADRVRAWRAARAVRDAASNAGADARFRREFFERSFGHRCRACYRLWFDNNLSNVQQPVQRCCFASHQGSLWEDDIVDAALEQGDVLEELGMEEEPSRLVAQEAHQRVSGGTNVSLASTASFSTQSFLQQDYEKHSKYVQVFLLPMLRHVKSQAAVKTVNLGTQTDAVSPGSRDVGSATDAEDCRGSFSRHSTPAEIQRLSEEFIVPDVLHSSFVCL